MRLVWAGKRFLLSISAKNNAFAYLQSLPHPPCNGKGPGGGERPSEAGAGAASRRAAGSFPGGGQEVYLDGIGFRVASKNLFE